MTACVYILRCSDDTLYTGWTNDINRRLAAGEPDEPQREREHPDVAPLMPGPEILDERQRGHRRHHA